MHKAKPGSKKIKTCECSDDQTNIVLRVTRVHGFPLVQKSALEKNEFSHYLVFLIHVIVY